ncbi:MAG TPA: flagellar biosynthetic protein FliO [Anaerovoracaceae bacterium]|nr:flagellar biosynthetic protein FliO [Anaerovoracaceae bacterium]
MFEDILSVLLATVGFICVVILTIFGSRWYARRMGTIAGGKHIHIIDRIVVGKSSTIIIIDVEGSQYLVGVNEHRIEIMKELDNPIDLRQPEKGESGLSMKSFKNYLHRGREND